MKKILYLEKNFELLIQLNNKKNLEKEKNDLKIKNELDKSFKEIKNEIADMLDEEREFV